MMKEKKNGTAVRFLLVSVALTLSLLSLLSLRCSADGENGTASTFPRAVLSDEADLLRSEEEAAILSEMFTVKEQYGFSLMIVTTDRPLMMSPDDYAYSRYTAEIGGSGALLLVSMDERDVYFLPEGSGVLLFDNRTDELLGKVIPSLSEGNYADAFFRFVRFIGDGLRAYEADSAAYLDTYGKEKGNNGWNDAYPDRPPRPTEKTWQSVFLGGHPLACAVIGLAVALIVTLLMKRGMNTVRAASDASHYLLYSSIDIRRTRDAFLHSTVTKVRIANESNGTRGGSHHGGGGGGHHGGGGKF